MDSSYIASIVKNEYKHQKEFYGFCWTPNHSSIKEADFDEVEMVRNLGKDLNIKPIFTNISKNLDSANNNSTICPQSCKYNKFRGIQINITTEKHDRNSV